ncbi:MAG: GTP-binding protein [Clostridia bacterium]|nr:GTP-binding protein [Clostridia bacterium]
MMKIDIFSGFLGAGKTTLIKKLIKEAYAGEKVVLIENEFGEIGIDGGFLQEAGINITEMNSGCICCSLVGDFAKALQQVAAEYAPDRIIIEPSGVGKLSDVIKAVKNANIDGGVLNAFCTVVDASKCKMYMKNFGEFFNDQVENASCIILSHTDKTSEDKIATAVAMLKEKNGTATVVTAVWDSLDGKAILAAMEQKDCLQAELDRLAHEVEHENHHHGHHEHEHHHDHECDDPDCCCHEHHGHEHHHHEHECDDPDCCCHEHHGHEHHHHEHECDDPDCCCHEHHGHEHHHHEHECDDPDCCCHEHHHGHHHADEVFTSWGVETARKYTKAEIEHALEELQHEEEYGTVLRAKGIVAGENAWIHFDYVPEEPDVREGGAAVTGRLCVIGCKLNEQAIAKLFKI